MRDARGRRSGGELIGEAFDAYPLVALYFSATVWSGLVTLGRIPGYRFSSDAEEQLSMPQLVAAHME